MFPERRHQMWAYFGGVLAVAVLLWLFRPTGPEFAEVSGIVTIDGVPIECVEVAFVPDPEKGSSGPISYSRTDAAGRYTMQCAKYAHDGVVLGTHRIVITDPTTLPPAPLPPSDDDSAPPVQTKGVAPPQPIQGDGPRINPNRIQRIPNRYGNVMATPFVGVEVKSGTNERNIELVSGKK